MSDGDRSEKPAAVCAVCKGMPMPRWNILTPRFNPPGCLECDAAGVAGMGASAQFMLLLAYIRYPIGRVNSPYPFEHLAAQMLEAGWLRSPAIAADGTIALNWTVQGAREAWLLKVICESYELHSPEVILKFDTDCHQRHNVAIGSLAMDGATVAIFWRDCIQSLNLPRTEEMLWELMDTALRWAPADESKLLFG